MIRLRPRSAKTGKPPPSPLWRLSGMGLELATHILAGALLGWVLDYWLNTEPTLLIVGTIAGVIVGMTEFIRTALKAQKKAVARAAQRGPKTAAADDGGTPMSKEESTDEPAACDEEPDD